MGQRYYTCIDLKSFYASVECAKRDLDPLTAHLVVADEERGRGAICLAITPALKELGIRNRCRLFEIPDSVDYLVAKPHMRHYMEVSAQIYQTYLRYISPEDIHVYSIDECFIDLTPYIELYQKTAHELTTMLMNAVLRRTGIYATAGIGTNLFLAKIALDITAKHVEDRIGYLDEKRFKKELWNHRPLTDFWCIGSGIQKRLAKYHTHTMYDITQMDKDVLHKEFGVNAEFLIDHAYGQEPCTIAEIQTYAPQGHSLTNGQILIRDYSYDEALVVLKEMIDGSVLDLVEQHLVAGGISIGVGYSCSKEDMAVFYALYAPTTGRPSARRFAMAGGSRKLSEYTNSRKALMEAFIELFNKHVDPHRAIKRIHLGLSDVRPEEFATFNLFSDHEALQKEQELQEAILAVKNKFGKNAMLKGTSLKKEATARTRNTLIGGHSA